MQDAVKLAKILAQNVTDDPFRKNRLEEAANQLGRKYLKMIISQYLKYQLQLPFVCFHPLENRVE
jgi:hypothetical protein